MSNRNYIDLISNNDYIRIFYIIFNCPLCLKSRQEIIERDLGFWLEESLAHKEIPKSYKIICSACDKIIPTPKSYKFLRQKWLLGECHPGYQSKLLDDNVNEEELYDMFRDAFGDKNGIILMSPESKWKVISSYSVAKNVNNKFDEIKENEIDYEPTEENENNGFFWKMVVTILIVIMIFITYKNQM
jgi:hypothetical protein